jgi:tetratricopeptide (TPR) repeat protein
MNNIDLPFRSLLKKPRLMMFLFLMLTGLLVYGRVVKYPFVHDDHVFIVSNPDIGNIGDLSYWTGPMPETAASLRNAYYRPLLELIYRVEYRLFGEDPSGYHLVNIFLHIINAFLIYLLFSRIGGKGFGEKAAFWAALFFLVHPVQTEAVACISGISNLVYVSFFLGSLLAFLSNGRISFLSLLLFALALFSKEQAVVLPVMVLAVHLLFPSIQKERQGKFFLMITLFLMTALYFVWRGIVLPGALPSLGSGPEFRLRMLAVPRELLMFLRLMIWPADLHYYRNIDILAPNGAAFAGLASLFALMGWTLTRIKGEAQRYALLGTVWFFFNLAPVLIAPLVNEYSLVLAAEHFLYLPLAGFLVSVLHAGKYFWEVCGAGKKVPVRNALAALAFIAVLLSWHQNRIWAGETVLFERTVKFEKEFGRGYLLLGTAYYFDQKFDQALTANKKALKIMEKYRELTKGNPAYSVYSGFAKGIHFDLAHCEEALGNIVSAREHYKAAIAIDPHDAELYNSLGVSFARLGDCGAAIGYFRRALDLNAYNQGAVRNIEMCERMLQTSSPPGGR